MRKFEALFSLDGSEAHWSLHRHRAHAQRPGANRFHIFLPLPIPPLPLPLPLLVCPKE